MQWMKIRDRSDVGSRPRYQDWKGEKRAGRHWCGVVAGLPHLEHFGCHLHQTIIYLRTDYLGWLTNLEAKVLTFG